MAKSAKQMVGLRDDMIATTATARVPAVGGIAKGGAGEPLNFRVTADFRRRFKQFALDHDMRLSVVLTEAFEALVRERGNGKG